MGIYTRYADDITFSTNKQTFPTKLATHQNSSISIKKLSEVKYVGLGLLLMIKKVDCYIKTQDKK